MSNEIRKLREQIMWSYYHFNQKFSKKIFEKEGKYLKKCYFLLEFP